MKSSRKYCAERESAQYPGLIKFDCCEGSVSVEFEEVKLTGAVSEL